MNIHALITIAALVYAGWAWWSQIEYCVFTSGVWLGWILSKAFGCCLVCNHTAKWDDVDYEVKQ